MCLRTKEFGSRNRVTTFHRECRSSEQRTGACGLADCATLTGRRLHQAKPNAAIRSELTSNRDWLNPILPCSPSGVDAQVRLLDNKRPLGARRADLVLGSTAEAYQERFLSMVNTLRQHGVEAPVCISIASKCLEPSNGGFKEHIPDNPVVRAQLALSRSGQGIREGVDSDALRPAVGGWAVYPSSSNSQSRDEVLNGPSNEPQFVELRHKFIGYDKETREEQTWKALLNR